MSNFYYIWDKETGVLRPCEDMIEWSRWFETANRSVARDEVNGINVFTSFLGIDHSFALASEPVLFETMCASDNHWFDLQIRYNNHLDALNGHRGVVEHLKKGGSPDDFTR